MPKPPHTLRCSEPDWKTLEEWARSRTQEARLVERAKIILQCVRGTLGQRHCAEVARAPEYRDRLAAAVRTRRRDRSGGSSAPGQAAAVWRGLSQAGAGRVGNTTAEGTSRLGRSSGRPASQDIRACCLACAAQGRCLPGPAA